MWRSSWLKGLINDTLKWWLNSPQPCLSLSTKSIRTLLECSFISNSITWEIGFCLVTRHSGKSVFLFIFKLIFNIIGLLTPCWDRSAISLSGFYFLASQFLFQTSHDFCFFINMYEKLGLFCRSSLSQLKQSTPSQQYLSFSLSNCLLICDPGKVTSCLWSQFVARVRSVIPATYSYYHCY